MSRAAQASPWVAAALLLAAPLVPAADAAGPGPVWRVSLRSDRHSDALPLAALGADDWRHLAPRPGRNLAYLDDELRLERSAGDWTVGLLARSQATLVASRESLQLAALVDSGQRPPADARWDADLRLRAFSGAGLALARRFRPAEHWSAGLSAQVLALGRWRERQIAGPVAFDAASRSYSFQLQSSETHDQLAFPFQQAFARRGSALLLGAELGWAAGAWSVQAALRDGGWLRWRGVPQQAARLDTDVLSQDADGFVRYQPLVQGRNSQAGLTRRMPWRGHLAIDHALADGHRLGLSMDSVPGFGVLPALAWQRRLRGLDLGLAWRLHERRLTVSLAGHGLSLRAGADRLDGRARSRELALGYDSTF